jgi:tetratricopeptide (TPR) repeat protein
MSQLFDQVMSDDLDKLILADPETALVNIRKLASTYDDQPFFRQNYGSRLIDIGRDLRSPELLREGICETEKVLDQTPTLRHQLLINVASAHRHLHLYTSKGAALDHADSDELSAAKSIFNSLKQTEQVFDGDTRHRYLVEFANCLSDMGRFSEATRLYEHALQVKPGDPIAIANLALSLREIALIADDPEDLREASGVFEQALATGELDGLGGLGTAERIRELKDEIDSVLRSRPQTPSAKKAVDPETYQGFCKRSQLFLNFCFHSDDCLHIPTDTLTFAFADVADENRLIRCARTINEIKQQFAVARLLVFESFCHPPYSGKADELTVYFDLTDESVYGVRSGKLKVAYETIFNLLDKIALFLNDYLHLGMPDKDISFRTIWKDNQKNIRPPFLANPSKYLRALYELKKELPHQEHLGVFTDIRNLLTHRYFVLHAKDGDWKNAADGDQYHAGYREFLDLTVQLLGLAKSATIYLIAFIRTTESRNLGTKTHYLRPVKCTRKDAGPLESMR